MREAALGPRAPAGAALKFGVPPPVPKIERSFPHRDRDALTARRPPPDPKRSTDLRGVDLRQAQLDGASFGSAKISGAYFPEDLAAEEIRLSVEYGTRVRAAKRPQG